MADSYYMEVLELIAAKLVLDEQPSEELPAVAADALSRGIDSPALRVLAGTSLREVREARDLFIAALDELGIDAPDEQDALWLLTRDVLERISRESIGAYEGATWIWRHVYWRIKREGDLRVFVGLASEWDDHPAERKALERDIHAAAVSLLSRGALRQWVKLQARQGDSPLRDPHSDRALALSELPISDRLRADLTTWAAEFDRVAADPGLGPSGFASSTEAGAFVDRGTQLAAAVQAELGDDWHVEYMPTPRQFP